MTENLTNLLPTLKEVFGFEDLREAQKPIVSSIMEGRDVLAILKTSGGKSLCFQLPAVKRGGLTLVISPLISLMKDQVDALMEKGIPAAYVNSNLVPDQIQERYRQLAEGGYRLFYVAPERFMDNNFLNALASSGLHTVAIDEAHCASQWGHDFRPNYSKIGAVLAEFESRVGRQFQRIAFTATATDRVREDICTMLQLRKPIVHQQGFDRENLTYAVIPSGKNRDQDIEGFLHEHPTECIIIYCTTVKRVEALYLYLKGAGLPVDRYHGKLSPEDKNRVQDDFINDKVRIWHGCG
jgi:ATP-dependent DNA helicase RecQ